MKTDEALSHADWCRLSRGFNDTANLGNTQDFRINEWLKRNIRRAAAAKIIEAQDGMEGWKRRVVAALRALKEPS